MKFVKGDSIAGIIITAINIAGGLAIGMGMFGLSLSEALHKYSMLTVGDGLVSQIPALLNAISAGIVVTRVTRGDDSSLARDLLQQLSQSRIAKFIGIFLGVLMASIPGMPTLPFLAMGLMLGVSIMLERPEVAVASQATTFVPRAVPPLTIGLSQDLMSLFQRSAEIIPLIERWREALHASSGLFVARPSFELIPDKEQTLQLSLRGILVRSVTMKVEQGTEGILQQAATFVTEHIVELLDDIMTRRLLDQFEQDAPELVAAVIPNLTTVTQITEILRMLAEEGITLRHFDLIMQAVAERAGKTTTERQVLEDVRVMLRRVISSKFATEGAVSGYLIDPEIDLSFLRAEREDRPIETGYVSNVVEALNDLSEPVLLCSKGSRRLVYDCLRARGLACTVLAHEELAAGVRFQRLGVISAEAVPLKVLREAA